jgi:CubicO group peptidase (beta-lactamase class C family)
LGVTRQVLPVAADAVYDMASVTKILSTTFLVMIAMDRGLTGPLDTPLSAYGWKGPADTVSLTLRNLLAHSSGLPAWKPLYLLGGKAREERSWMAREAILRERPLFDQGSETLYSDLGFMLLGFLAEEILGAPLDELFRREIAVPLGLTGAGFLPLGPGGFASGAPGCLGPEEDAGAGGEICPGVPPLPVGEACRLEGDSPAGEVCPEVTPLRVGGAFREADALPGGEFDSGAPHLSLGKTCRGMDDRAFPEGEVRTGEPSIRDGEACLRAGTLAAGGIPPADVVRSAGNMPVAPTEDGFRCGGPLDWPGVPVLGPVPPGRVHDDNAAWLGGVAGHAGLFAVAGDVARIVSSWQESFSGTGGIVSSGTAREFMSVRKNAGNGVAGPFRGLGFDSVPHLSGRGVLFGHKGYTGATVWFDPGGDGAVMLLCNRVHPTARRGGMDRVRAGLLRLAFRE